MASTPIPQDVLDAITAAHDARDAALEADQLAAASAAAVVTAQAQATADKGNALTAHQHAGEMSEAALRKVEEYLGIEMSS